MNGNRAFNWNAVETEQLAELIYKTSPLRPRPTKLSTTTIDVFVAGAQFRKYNEQFYPQTADLPCKNFVDGRMPRESLA